MLLDLIIIFVTEINYIQKNKLRITLKYHYFEVVTFEILDIEGYKYEKVDTSVGDELSVIINKIFIEIKYIPKTKSSKTLKYHWFEVVTFEILDLKGHKYKIIDFLSWLCAPGPQ